jgi:ATP-dependent Lon protease
MGIMASSSSSFDEQ